MKEERLGGAELVGAERVRRGDILWQRVDQWLDPCAAWIRGKNKRLRTVGSESKA